ncbi:hypothetical protein [Pseudomonas sp.]|uniref:hypothetical protein n=1 Tax=Pseudomonas sp. TaxID=306 RepID=UPI002D0BA6F6|nr:hypothetical protein [Pseudomonas sp.]HUE92484.1 hypothetical protein [Pseudomonas sp.]
MFAHESELDSKERLGPFDGLYGAAILLVLAYHVWGNISGLSQLPNDLFIFSFLYTSNTGVTLFFLLSGFLVSCLFSWAARFKQLPLPSNYFPQRALGIPLPYSTTFLVGILLTFLSINSTRNLEFKNASLSVLLVLLALVLIPAAQVGAKAYIWHTPWYVLPEALLWGAIMWIMLVRVSPRFSLLDNRMTCFFL